MDSLIRILVLLQILLLFTSNTEPFRVVCTYFGMVEDIYSNFRISAKEVDSRPCTHTIFYSGAMSPFGELYLIPFLPGDRPDLTPLQDLVKMREVNPKVKILLSTTFVTDFTKKESRDLLINSTLNYLKDYNLDGIDFFPYDRTVSAAFQEGMAKFVRELGEALKKNNHILSLSVKRFSPLIPVNEFPGISRYVEFINLFLPGVIRSNNTVLSHIAPLYGATEEEDSPAMASYLEFWLGKDIDPKLINMMVSCRGRYVKLKDPSKHTIGSPVVKESLRDLPYFKICGNLHSSAWTQEWDKVRKVPYARKNDEVILYENQQSIKEKVKYLREKNFGGIMYWRFESDDFRGHCGDKYAILKAMKYYSDYDFSSESADNACVRQEYIEHPSDCTKFIYCSPSENGGFQQYVFDCSEGQAYSQRRGSCIKADLVDCQ